MFAKKTLRDVDVKGKRVLMRVDFNVPIDESGQVTDDTRIRAALPTIRYLAEHKAKTILMSHLGRPQGAPDARFNLQPVADQLARLLGQPVQKLGDTVGEIPRFSIERMKPGDVVMLENVRFDPGETANDARFAKQLASLADIYANDAFGAAHRTHASTVGVTRFLPAVAGFLLEREVTTLSRLLENPARPFVAVLGGSKVSDKVGVVNKFLDVVDGLFIGGGMCFTFLKAQGLEIGKSICENEELEHAAQMLAKASTNEVAFHLPEDIVVARERSEDAVATVVEADDIPSDEMGLDIGPVTVEIYQSAIAKAETIFWNGPMGVFELQPFEAGTREVATAIANSGATTIVGGGDSDAALRKFGLEEKMSFVSTGGGASMKMLEGVELPGVAALEDK